MDGIRERLERAEQSLSPHAARSALSLGRAAHEQPDPMRTCYMRDRDRVLHSKAFRRLKHKAQVFIDPVGDHYRTRLTHTLEVAQIARTIARSLRLNEDLTEAIALAHDVGHSPFGHIGERAIDRFLREHGDPAGFRHEAQSRRVLEVLEPLNLCWETLEGVEGHSKGRKDLGLDVGESSSTLEAAVVRISDRIAYLNHDIDDAMRSGFIVEVPSLFDQLGTTHSQRISAMVFDVVSHSRDQPRITLSEPMLQMLNELKEWLFEHVYLRYPEVYPESAKAERLVMDLLAHFTAPGNLPEGFHGMQGAVDYVSGMTDRFAMELFVHLRVPKGLI